MGHLANNIATILRRNDSQHNLSTIEAIKQMFAANAIYMKQKKLQEFYHEPIIFFIHCTTDCLAMTTVAFEECNEFSRCLLTYLPAENSALIVAGFNLGVGYQV